MANPEHVEILRRGAEAWNKWVFGHRRPAPDLSEVQLVGAELKTADFSGVDLHRANLMGADLRRAIFGADADLSKADLRGADLREAIIVRGARFKHTDISGTDLRGAVVEAKLHGVDLHDADLRGTDFRGAEFLGVDLRGALVSKDTLWPAGCEAEAQGAIAVGQERQSERRTEEDFTIAFAPELPPEQVSSTLGALANYYRACGGVGFRVEFEIEEALLRHPSNAL